MSDLDVRLESKKIFDDLVKQGKFFYCYIFMNHKDGEKIITNNSDIIMGLEQILNILSFYYCINLDDQECKENFLKNILYNIKELYKSFLEEFKKEPIHLNQFLIDSVRDFENLKFNKKNLFEKSYKILKKEFENKNNVFTSSVFYIFENNNLFVSSVHGFINVFPILRDLFVNSPQIIQQIYEMIEINKTFENIDEYIDFLIKEIKEKKINIIDCGKDFIIENIH